MIHYDGAKFHPRLLVQAKGSVFPFSCLVALPAAALSVVLKMLVTTYADEAGFDSLGLSDPDTVLGVAWSSVSSLLGFLVVFRTSQAYARFWEGTTAMHQMLGEWFDATSSLFAFCKRSNGDKKFVLVFQHTLVRLVSLLNAVVLMDLAGGGSKGDGLDDTNERANELELIDAEGIDQQSLVSIHEAEDKVELIFQWVQQLIVEADTRKVFSIAPPILSRAFQELAQGMVKYHDAAKIAKVPLPFPYMQTMEVLLVFHWIVTPFLTSMWVQSALWTPILTFIQIFFFWSLNCIACELENPFGHDVNDLPTQAMQFEMNRKLLLLLRPSTQRTARLSPQAALDEHEDPGRPHKMRLGSASNLGKSGVSGLSALVKTDRVMNKRISLGSLQQSIQDQSSVELELLESEGSVRPHIFTSEGSFHQEITPAAEATHRTREISLASESYKLKEVDNPNESYYDWCQPRGFEEKALACVDDLGQRIQQVVTVCEDIRDRMKKFEGESLRDRMAAVLLQQVNGGHEEEFPPLNGKRLPPQPHGPVAPPEIPLAAKPPGGGSSRCSSVSTGIPLSAQIREGEVREHVPLPAEMVCCRSSSAKPTDKIYKNAFKKPP